MKEKEQEIFKSKGWQAVNRIGILHKVELLQLYRREIKMLSMTIKSETKVPLAIWGKLLYNSM